MPDPLITLGAIATVLKIVDSVTGQWDRYLGKPKSPKPHRVTTELAGDTIIVKESGQQVETITAADLTKLDPNSCQLIESFEKSMQRQFDLWTKVYPTKDMSTDPVVNAQVEQRLNDIMKKMCHDLGEIFGYLDTIGKYLEDHYDHARFLCRSVQQKIK
jgi:hypothetical protein